MTANKKSDAPRDPVRRWTLIVLGLIVVLLKPWEDPPCFGDRDGDGSADVLLSGC